MMRVLGMWVIGVLGSSAMSVDAGVAHRYWLASQYSWGDNRGVCLAFENSSDGNACSIGGMKLVWMVGDGKQFGYVYAPTRWELNREYVIRAVATKGQMELFVDGVSCGKAGVKLRPMRGVSMKANVVSPEHQGPCDFLFMPISTKMVSGRTTILDATFSGSQRSMPEIVADPSGGDAGREFAAKVGSDETLTIETRVKFIAPPKAADYAPYVDRYFQWRYGDWPGKVKSDEELRGRVAEEEAILREMPARTDEDRFGGVKIDGWKESATGFFRVVQKNGVSWLISPEGNPCFYIGLCCVGLDADTVWPPTPVTGRETFFESLPPKTGEWSAAWDIGAWGAAGQESVRPITTNLIRKYGDGWQAKKNASTFRRMKAWGFSGGGKWARTNPEPIRFAWVAVLNPSGVPTLAGHADVYDEHVRGKLDAALKEQCQAVCDNPWLVGVSVGNEDAEMIQLDEVKAILGRDASVAAKKALVEFGVEKLYGGKVAKAAKAWSQVGATTIEQLCASTTLQVPANDLDAMRLEYSERYYAFLYQTVKKYDRNHLYFGYWIPGWRAIWTHPKDWYVIAKYCDVLGYDHYDATFARVEMQKRISDIGKPVFCGEFGWAPMYGGKRGFASPGGGGWSTDDADSAKKYRQWIEDAASHPQCVGVAYFEQHDMCCLGRGPGSGEQLHLGESCAWGLIDITDTPKWELVRAVRQANLRATAVRMELTQSRAATSTQPSTRENQTR